MIYNIKAQTPHKSKLFNIVFLLLMSCTVWSQEVSPCGQHEHLNRVKTDHPEFALELARVKNHNLSENETQRSGGGEDNETVLTVPVVFHIIHDNGPENISDFQVYDAMDILNEQMAGLNEDLVEVIDTFTTIIGNPNIEFKLAKRDPEGNCTKGINRVESALTYDGFNSDMKDLSRWPRDQYLNVWVCNLAGDAAGFSNLPNNVNGAFGALIDGIVLRYDYVGIEEPSSESNSKTFAHEVGHWLNLRHTWGNGNEPAVLSNCNQDDGVEDTPLTLGWTTCAENSSSCGSLDNVQNYMEYSGCRFMFTQGQAQRMRNALNSLTAQRFNLWQLENLEATGVAEESLICGVDFLSEKRTECSGTPINFRDLSYSDPLYWEWNFGDGVTIDGNNLADPVHTYTEAGTYTVSLRVSDGLDTLELVKEDYITILNASQIIPSVEESFEDYDALTSFENDWFNSPQNEFYDWEISESASITGDQSAFIRNFMNQDLEEISELISAPIDFSNQEDIYVYYKWAFATLEEETDDRLRVFISNDCGETWDPKKLHRGVSDLPSAPGTNAEFFPNEDQWISDYFTENDEEFLVPGVRIKFQFTNRGGNNLFLEDINIGSSEELNVAEKSLDQTIRIFPNPSNSDQQELFIATEANVSISELRLFSSEGKLISDQLTEKTGSSHNNSYAIQRSGLAPGVYFIHLLANGVMVRKKWILVN